MRSEVVRLGTGREGRASVRIYTRIDEEKVNLVGAFEDLGWFFHIYWE